MQISGNEPSSYSKRAQRCDHEHRKVPTASAPELQGPDWILGPLLVSGDVFEGPPDGLGHVDKKLAGVGRSVLAEKPGSPAIELEGRGQRRDEGRKVRPIFHGVGKRMGSGKILDIGCAEASRRVVDANGAFEAKLRSPFCETDDRDMIAESIPRPGKLARRRRDFERPDRRRQGPAGMGSAARAPSAPGFSGTRGNRGAQDCVTFTCVEAATIIAVCGAACGIARQHKQAVPLTQHNEGVSQLFRFGS